MIVYIVKKEDRIKGVYDSREKAAYVTDTLNEHEYLYCGADLNGPQNHIEEYEIE